VNQYKEAYEALKNEIKEENTIARDRYFNTPDEYNLGKYRMSHRLNFMLEMIDYELGERNSEETSLMQGG